MANTVYRYDTFTCIAWVDGRAIKAEAYKPHGFDLHNTYGVFVPLIALPNDMAQQIRERSPFTSEVMVEVPADKVTRISDHVEFA